MKLHNNALFLYALECVGSTGVMKFLQQFAEADPGNAKVLEELYKVNHEFVCRQEHLYKLISRIGMLGLFLIIYPLAMFGFYMFIEAGTYNFGIYSILFVLGVIIAAIYRPLRRKHKLPCRSLTLNFSGDKYPALARFEQCNNAFKDHGIQVQFYKEPCVEITEIKNKIEEFAKSRVISSLQTKERLNSKSSESEWDGLDLFNNETKRVLNLFSQVGFWHADWRERLEKLEEDEKRRVKAL